MLHRNTDVLQSKMPLNKGFFENRITIVLHIYRMFYSHGNLPGKERKNENGKENDLCSIRRRYCKKTRSVTDHVKTKC